MWSTVVYQLSIFLQIIWTLKLYFLLEEIKTQLFTQIMHCMLNRHTFTSGNKIGNFDWTRNKQTTKQNKQKQKQNKTKNKQTNKKKTRSAYLNPRLTKGVTTPLRICLCRPKTKKKVTLTI